MTSEVVLSWFAQLLAAGGGGAIVAYFLFKYLGDNWIKHKLATNLERAKSEISLLAARKMKLHDREYVVFPELWARLNRAFARLGTAVNPLKEFADLSRLNETDLDKWLAGSNLSDNERDFLHDASDKNSAYSRILNRRSLHKAHDEFLRFHTYFRENRIFLSPDIKEKLDLIDDLIQDSWLNQKFSIDEHDTDEGRKFTREAWNKYQKEIKPVLDELEELFQQKIFPDAPKTASS